MDDEVAECCKTGKIRSVSFMVYPRFTAQWTHVTTANKTKFYPLF